MPTVYCTPNTGALAMTSLLTCGPRRDKPSRAMLPHSRPSQWRPRNTFQPWGVIARWPRGERAIASDFVLSCPAPSSSAVERKGQRRAIPAMQVPVVPPSPPHPTTHHRSRPNTSCTVKPRDESMRSLINHSRRNSQTALPTCDHMRSGTHTHIHNVAIVSGVALRRMPPSSGGCGRTKDRVALGNHFATSRVRLFHSLPTVPTLSPHTTHRTPFHNPYSCAV